MRKDRKHTSEEMLEEYIKIGAYTKMLYIISLTTASKVEAKFGKTNKLTKKIDKITREFLKLRSDLEETMPYEETKRVCEKEGVDPLEIFYGYMSEKQKEMFCNDFKDWLKEEKNEIRTDEYNEYAYGEDL